MIADNSKPSLWWGDFNFTTGQIKQWNIGPLTLVIQNLKNEWQVAHERIDEHEYNHADWSHTDTDILPETLSNNSRYVFTDSSGQLNIHPKLADRPVISRPHIPFNLTAGDDVILYVSTPLWLEISVGTAPKKILQEIPIQRPSDTWFGASTLEGELCYATTTHCRLRLEDLPQRPHRAITPVQIHNHADSTLSVERINIPVPLLPLFASTNGLLWTPQIIMTREQDGDMAELKIDNNAPQEADGAARIAEQRITADSGTLIRAFSAVFK